MRTFFAATLFLAAFASSHAYELEVSSSDRQTPLVELFTSEGCSSCPPAERWLNRLTANRQLWRDFVPVAFHVDYWDYIGWPDRFADRRYSDRQRRYAFEGGVNTVYTPGMFVNGQAWNGWRRADTPSPTRPQAGTLLVDVSGEQMTLAYRPVLTDPSRLHAQVALLGFGLASDVKAGENRGRTLEHHFVVLATKQVPLANANGRLVAELPLPESELQAERYGVAVWVAGNNAQRPLQAVGGFLRKE